MTLLLLLLAIPAWLVGKEPVQVPENRIGITGKCYNVATNETVPCTARISSKNAVQEKQGFSPGMLDFELDRSATMLYFDAPGFETNSFPVNLIGEIPEHTTFEIQIPLIRNGLSPAMRAKHLALAPATLLAVHLQFPDSLETVFIMHDISTQKISSTFTFQLKNGKPEQMLTAIPGPYVFRATALQSDKVSLEDILTNENVIVKAGLNFLAAHDVRFTPKTAGKPASKPVIVPTKNPGSLTLPFSRSSYALSTGVKITLDSIAMLLKTHRNRTAHITGHTDNVGRRIPNVALSEYRVRVVENYLRKKGVLEQQLSLNWKGPDEPVMPNDSEENKIRNRRVEVSFSVK
ncbi:OmpA family protein [Dyadobacter aurulentus]|uniref:OmpA family protein n=1 Tax=Dyadobacter sp. UC 10 TaxID=2605428 RepID=UPI0011F39C83|nr:OmpA family protein [Dyadobacter sp. UC 10]KAA0993830.1 OmpA family protein [Dyadobacter sp. UC 10]